MLRIERWLPLALLVPTLFAAGCGGGADARTTVTYLPSKSGESVGEVGTGTTAPAEPVAEGFGTIVGKIVFQGDAASLAPLYAKGAAPKDTSVCGAEAVPNETVVVNNGGLANVFIYLPKAPKGALPPANTEPVIFDQKFCVFKPHAILVRTGQPVKILNDDAVAHNTRASGKKNSPFNQIVAPSDREGTSLVYKNAENEPVQVGCDIHSWMTAYHLPVDHPYAALSDAEGKFEIKDVPAGKHQFKIWHEKGGVLEKAFVITVKAGETVPVEIPVAASKVAEFHGPPSKVLQLSSTR